MDKLTEAATQSSLAERRAMEVEREIVDIYRCFYMIDHIGERFEGTVSAFVGTGAFVTLDEPFVDVLVRVEDMGADYQIEDDGLMATSSRSGDAIRLGDRMLVDVTDCAILRRTVYAKRVRSEADAADDLLARRRERRRARTRGRRGARRAPRSAGAQRGRQGRAGTRRRGRTRTRRRRRARAAGRAPARWRARRAARRASGGAEPAAASADAGARSAAAAAAARERRAAAARSARRASAAERPCDLTDDRNCCIAGRDCHGGGCIAGKCQPVKVVTDATGDARGIAVSNDTLLWATGCSGIVRKVRNDGAGNVALPAGPNCTPTLAVSGKLRLLGRVQRPQPDAHGHRRHRRREDRRRDPGRPAPNRSSRASRSMAPAPTGQPRPREACGTPSLDADHAMASPIATAPSPGLTRQRSLLRLARPSSGVEASRRRRRMSQITIER